MKKHFIILSFFFLVFLGCETDFPVNAHWEDTTIVYGLLDANKDTQFVRINKAFLGEMDAQDMAQYSDSINYDPNDLIVMLYKLGTSGDTISSILFDTTLIDKEEGYFASNNNVIYTAITNSNFLDDNKRYVLSIKNIRTQNHVSANTEVIENFAFDDIEQGDKFNFYNPFSAIPFRTKTISWQKSLHGEIYQLDIRLNFLENNEPKSLIWGQDLSIFNGSQQMKLTLEGLEFFSFLRNNLEQNEDIIRKFIDLDIIMTVGTEDLHTYIKVNEPITGIVQERPQFTNINNGIGIFSSRYTDQVSGIILKQETIDYLINDLDRNFTQ